MSNSLIDVPKIGDVPEVGVPATPWWELAEDAADIIMQELPPIIEIIKGIVAEESKLVIGSGSKSFKTWVSIDAGISIAHGIPFLGRATTQRPVLYVNLELKPQTFKRRLQILAKTKNVRIDRSKFFHLPLRGKLASLGVSQIVSRIIQTAKHHSTAVVIVDPVYKMNVEGEENCSRDQTLFFNQLDRITTEGNCTLILNDHFGKGNQSEKDPLDTIRGSSAKGGDVDAAMILRAHEVANCFRVDIIHRELEPVEPFCIEWQFPLMRLRDDLNAAAMRKAKAGRRKAHDPAILCAAIIDHPHTNPISIAAWAKAAGISRTTLSDYIPNMHARGWIATIGEGASTRQYITQTGLSVAKKMRGDR